MTDIDYAARVAKGVALLDAKEPGWERKLDLETLDIENGARCVTAQLHPDEYDENSSWMNGMYALDLTSGNGGSYVAHGFNIELHEVGEGPEDYDRDGAYAKLNTLWREVIEGRLSASAEPAAG